MRRLREVFGVTPFASHCSRHDSSLAWDLRRLLDRRVDIVTAIVATFAALPPGWHSYQSIATSWPYSPGQRPGGPADYIPRRGIIVNVMFPTTHQRFKPLRLVLPPRPTTMLEGTKDTPEFRIEGRIHGVNVLIFVDIREHHPTLCEKRVAQRVVSAIRFR